MRIESWRKTVVVVTLILVSSFMTSCGSKISSKTPIASSTTQTTGETVQSTTTTAPPIMAMGDVEQLYDSSGNSTFTVSATGFIPSITLQCGSYIACEAPPSGTNYSAVSLTFDNDGSVEQIIYPLQIITLLSTSGQQYSPTLLYSATNQCDTSFVGNTSAELLPTLQYGLSLIAGQSVSGCLIFEVPTDFTVGEVELATTPPSFWNMS